MDSRVEQNIPEEYADNLTLTKDEMTVYDIPATYERVVEKLREFKIARKMSYNVVNNDSNIIVN